MRQLLLLLTFSAFFFSCKKNPACNNDQIESGEKLQIYLLKWYQWEAGKCRVDAGTAILEDEALVENKEVIAYNKATCQFTVTTSAFQKIQALNDKVPFAVVVDRQVIYYGIVKPFYSSSSCAHSITMNYIGADNTIQMNLGYAGADDTINDERNHPKIIATLQCQGKLR